MNDLRQSNSNFIMRARSDFEAARRKSNLRSVITALTRTSNQLLPYDQVLKALPIKGQHYIGIRQVPIDAIVGSVGRFQDFDRAFLPKRATTRGRWESIDRAHLMDVELPAVELYKVGEVYFVKDGNHRVSVARERGQAFIDAVVIEIDTTIPITPETNLLDLIGKRQMERFYRKTRLKEIRPEATINLTFPELYSRLLEHILTHGWFLGEERQEAIAFTDATASWYDNIYQPMVGIIREKKILSAFPDRTEADLYVWIMEHRWFLMKENQSDISLEEAASDFVKGYAKNPAQRLLHRIMKFFSSKD